MLRHFWKHLISLDLAPLSFLILLQSLLLVWLMIVPSAATLLYLAVIIPIGPVICMLLQRYWKQQYSQLDINFNTLKKAMSPGELFDKQTILLIKEGKHVGNRKTIINEINLLWRAQQLYTAQLDNSQHNQLNTLFSKLYLCNLHQWELEDKVRSEKSTEAAVAARENNTQRVALKNEINKLFGATLEAKKYKE